MFTSDEIKEISDCFASGQTPEDVAKQLKISPSGLRGRLLNSGYRIIVTRQLEAIRPVAALQPAMV